MVPCTLMRKLSFLLWYTSLQYLVLYAFDALVPASTMTLGKVVVGTQFVWLMCTYLFAMSIGVYTKFVTASEEEKQDENTSESGGDGGRNNAASKAETTADQLVTVGLSMLLVVMLANCFALFASTASTIYQTGDGMMRSLWGTTGARVCVWVLFIMQSQLVVSTYLMSTHYNRAAPLGAGQQLSLALYSVCHALLVLGFCAHAYTLELEQNESGASASDPDDADLVQTRYWLAHSRREIIITIAAICTCADLVVNIVIINKAPLRDESSETLPDKRYLKIGLLWISLLSGLVIMGLSDHGAYVLVVLFPPLVLVVLISWHYYKTHGVFSRAREKVLPAPANTGDAFNAASKLGDIGSSTARISRATLPKLRHKSARKAEDKGTSPLRTVSADLVYKTGPKPSPAASTSKAEQKWTSPLRIVSSDLVYNNTRANGKVAAS